MSTTPNRSGKPSGTKYLLMPESARIRVWYVMEGSLLSRGPSSDSPRALRNKLTRWGMIEVTLADLGLTNAAVVAAGERL